MHTRDDPDPLLATAHRAPKVEPPAAGPSAEGADGDTRSMLELQRLAGNASVSRLLARQPALETDEAIEQSSPVLDIVGRGGGEPLAPELRAEMEGRLGADFGAVRVHRDAAASDSARAVDAHAYTVGTDVVFRSDRWDPASSEGKHTLAHELSHVVQQASGPVEGSPAAGGIRVSSPSDSFERAADRQADAALARPAPTGSAQAEAGPGGPSAPAAQLDAGAPEEDEEEEAAGAGAIQREGAAPEEEEEEAAGAGAIQREGAAPEEEEEEAAGAGAIQREAAPEDELEEEVPG